MKTVKDIGVFLLELVVWVLSWIYIICFLYPVSVVANLYWLIRIVKDGKLKYTIESMIQQSDKMKHINTLFKAYNQFSYQYDGIADCAGIFGKWPTWIPLTVVFFYRYMADNCDGAESYARWLVKQYNKNRINKAQNAKVKIQKQILVPINPLNLGKVHYYNTLQLYKDEWLLSNGKVKSINKLDRFGVYKMMCKVPAVKLYPWRKK